MTLYLIGLGLGDEQGLTLAGLAAAKRCGMVYLETYTSPTPSRQALERLIGKPVLPAGRQLVEQDAERTLLAAAKDGDACLLVPGDPYAATTHMDLALRARQLKIPIQAIHNASILTAVGETGLQLYKFGRTGSIPFPAPGYEPETPYDLLKENQKAGSHTLFLLDLKPDEGRHMAVNDAIRILQKIEVRRGEKAFTGETPCIGCARLGRPDSRIRAGPAKALVKEDFGPPPHCLIIPGRLHFIEEEALAQWQ
jgi:diphthine synthase